MMLSSQSCTQCGGKIQSREDRRKHQVLGVLQCKSCHVSYKSVGDLTRYRGGVDLSGNDNYCRWCLDGGDLILCGDVNCRNGFCRNCINRNLGHGSDIKIEKATNWYCFVCDYMQLPTSYTSMLASRIPKTILNQPESEPIKKLTLKNMQFNFKIFSSSKLCSQTKKLDDLETVFDSKEISNVTETATPEISEPMNINSPEPIIPRLPENMISESSEPMITNLPEPIIPILPETMISEPSQPMISNLPIVSKLSESIISKSSQPIIDKSSQRLVISEPMIVDSNPYKLLEDDLMLSDSDDDSKFLEAMDHPIELSNDPKLITDQDLEIVRALEVHASKFQAAENEAKKRIAQKEAIKKAAEEEIRRRAAEETAKRRATEEEARRRVAEETAKRRATEEEARKRIVEEAAKRRAAEEEARRKAAEEVAKKQAIEEEAKKQVASDIPVSRTLRWALKDGKLLCDRLRIHCEALQSALESYDETRFKEDPMSLFSWAKNIESFLEHSQHISDRCAHLYHHIPSFKNPQ